MKLKSRQSQTRSLIFAACLAGACVAGAARADEPALSAANGTRDNLTRGYKLIDGDIQVPNDFDPMQRMTYNTNLWTGGIVYYEWDANVSAANRTNMVNAMVQWTNVANVSFVLRSNQGNYAHIQDSTANNSAVGMVGGSQIINITSWTSVFIVAHELGHCLGLFHEHQRPDRDTYLFINQNNVQGGPSGTIYLNNFPVQGAAHGYGPYDFDSVMQYDGCSFSICCPAGSTCACPSNCQTITVLPPNDTAWQANIGQRTHLSTYDQLIMSMLYPNGGDRFLDRNYFGPQSGTFVQPWNISFASAFSQTPVNLFIQPGSYSAVGTYNTPKTLKAPIGGVTLGS